VNGGVLAEISAFASVN